MRVLSAAEAREVRAGDYCTNLQAGIFVAMTMLQFEVALALALAYAIWC